MPHWFWFAYAAVGLSQSFVFVLQGVRVAKVRMQEKREEFLLHRRSAHNEPEDVAKARAYEHVRRVWQQLLWQYTPFMIALSLLYMLVWPFSLGLRLYGWLRGRVANR
jgi:hypothetical protein